MADGDSQTLSLVMGGCGFADRNCRLIICGDEDDACVEPSVFLKNHLPAAGLTFFPKSGHVLNLEEPALFNEMVERFIALFEAGRWGVRDPRSIAG